MKVLDFIKTRLTERSTWVGIGIFSGAVAVALGNHATLYAALLAGLAAVLTPGGK